MKPSLMPVVCKLHCVVFEFLLLFLFFYITLCVFCFQMALRIS